MANEVAVRDVRESVVRRMPEIAKALPPTIPSEKFQRVFEGALLKSPELLKCEPKSVYESVCKCAADGLVLDGREAALVTFKKNRKEGNQWVTTLQAQYIPMVGGMLKRARNSGEISSIRSGIVYANEIEAGQFAYVEGIDGSLTHTPILVGPRGDPVAAYSIAKLKDGTWDVCVMRADEITAIKVRSRSKDKDGKLTGPWVTDEMEMWKKTVLRRHCKTLPMDSDVARVFQRVDEMYGLKAQPAQAAPAGGGGVAAKRLAQAKAAREEGLDANLETGEVTEVEPEPEQVKPKKAPPAQEQIEDAEIIDDGEPF